MLRARFPEPAAVGGQQQSADGGRGRRPTEGRRSVADGQRSAAGRKRLVAGGRRALAGAFAHAHKFINKCMCLRCSVCTQCYLGYAGMFNFCMLRRVRHRPSQNPIWRLFAEKELEQFFFSPASHHESNGVDPEGDGVDPEDNHTDAWIAALRRDGPVLLARLAGNRQDSQTCLGVVWSASAFTSFRSTQPAFEIRDKAVRKGALRDR